MTGMRLWIGAHSSFGSVVTMLKEISSGLVDRRRRDA
jgi:hypothetical protein